MNEKQKRWLKNPVIKEAVYNEIGDLIYHDTFELIPKKQECRTILMARGFSQRSGVEDWIKYVLGGKYRIHVKPVESGNCYYHLDNH